MVAVAFYGFLRDLTYLTVGQRKRKTDISGGIFQSCNVLFEPKRAIIIGDQEVKHAKTPEDNNVLDRDGCLVRFDEFSVDVVNVHVVSCILGGIGAHESENPLGYSTEKYINFTAEPPDTDDAPYFVFVRAIFYNVSIIDWYGSLYSRR